MDTQQLIAWDSKIGKAYLIPKGKTDTTHKVRNPRNHYEADARIQLWVETKKEWVDPHDLEEGHSFSIVGYLIEMDGLQEVLQPPEEVEVVKPLTILEEWQFEIPSMIFVFVPSKTTHTYDLVKTVSNFGLC